MELGRNRAERALELGAEIRHHADHRNRNTGRDQPVLDRGCAGLIFEETHNKLRHIRAFKISGRSTGGFARTRNIAPSNSNSVVFRRLSPSKAEPLGRDNSQSPDVFK